MSYDIEMLFITNSYLMYNFSEKLSTENKVDSQKKGANMRTYTQTVDNLWVKCDLSIYSGWFFTIICE